MNENEVVLPFHDPVREAHHIESAGDEVAPARCPWCRAPLRVEMSCRGPRFVCLCEEARAA